MKDPLILPLVALSGGILLSRWVRFEAREVAIILPLLFALTGVAWKRAPLLITPCCLFSILFCGVWIDTLHRPGAVPEIDAGVRETVLLSGCVVEPPAFYEGRDQFVLELAPKARARVTLAIRDGEIPPPLSYGQLIEIEARVRPIRNFQNPGAFDYQSYEARSGIYWTASAAEGSRVAIQPGRCGSRFFAAIFTLRTAALNRLESLYQGNPYATGMLEATLIGETRKLEKIWTDHFRRTGTYHMLVIDGLHITVLAAFLLFLLRLCMLPELGALAITAGGAWLYAMVSGLNAPAVRAAGGFTLYVVCRYFYRRRRLLNLLAAVAIIYLLYDPGQLFEAGFQLSFLSVAAIAALAIPMLEASSAPFAGGLRGISESSRDPRMPPRPAQFRLELRLLAETLHYYVRIPQVWLLRLLAFGARLVFFAWEIAVISTVIQIGLALPMAIYFHRISLSGLSANIIVVPLLGLVVPIGFVAIFTGWHVPAAIAEWLLAAGEKVANWHLLLEPDCRVLDPPLWLSIAFSIALLALAFAIRRSRAWGFAATSAALGLFALIFWHPFAPQVHRGELELTAVDVGQGDSLLVSFPNGKLMLVDGGGVLSFGRRSKPKIDIGEDVVSPYLWSRSIGKVDVVALTHAHDDHAAGLPALIDNFHPTELWTGATPESASWSAVEAKARARKVKITAMQSGRIFDFGGTRIEIVSPPADYALADRPQNNDSLALRITYGRRSFLLTGDMEKPMELRAIAGGEPLHADVLKVGHHGSNSSSTDLFLDAVSPAFAVISDGFENSFRHPHPQVLARLAAHRATTLRTDRQGLITIRTDGDRLTLETYLPTIH
ncbi:MAG TPA: ComEC/Rec2 family competence protein [Bryobacteraceae bacterium]|nr:ComEC/Rec2 family competence protein [Bryobacteraceae bacterium]